MGALIMSSSVLLFTSLHCELSLLVISGRKRKILCDRILKVLKGENSDTSEPQNVIRKNICKTESI